MVSALMYCHEEAQVIHRDIKPENVIFTNGKAIIVDFGVSEIFSGDDDTVRDTVGSMRYFAPEQVKTGKKTIFGTKTDLWAFAVTIY